MFYHKTMFKKLGIFFLMIFSILGQPALSNTDKVDQSQWLRKIENYMNASKAWEAQFEQLNPNGSLYEGKLYLQRPGRLRLVYTYPKDQIMLADGTWLIIHDPENDELTTLALKETPAFFFLKESIDFSKEVIVQDFEIEDGLVRVTIARSDEPDAGSLTLTFIQNPLKLVQWITLDANQLKTVINLKNIQTKKSYDPSLFVFNRPDLLR